MERGACQPECSPEHRVLGERVIPAVRWLSVGTPGHVWGRFGVVTAEADAAGLQGVEAGCLSTPGKAQGSPHGQSDSTPSVKGARWRSQVSAPCSQGGASRLERVLHEHSHCHLPTLESHPQPRVGLGWPSQDAGVSGTSLDLRRVSEGRRGVQPGLGREQCPPAPHPPFGGPLLTR